MPIELIGFVLFAASMIGTPGPANMVVMASGARFGARASLPFLFGVILGKQFIIWPLGLGVLSALGPDSAVFQVLKWASIAYILYLAWVISRGRIVEGNVDAGPPGFLNGLIVHPLNPKAWAMIIGVLTNFVDPQAPALVVTAAVAAGFLCVQLVLQPLWMLAGVKIAEVVAGTNSEVWMMRGLAAAMIVSVVYVLLKGE